MLRGAEIQGIVPGGPAFNSSMLAIGDVIVGIDGAEITEEDVAIRLVGEDVAGSMVTLTVQKHKEKVK